MRTRETPVDHRGGRYPAAGQPVHGATLASGRRRPAVPQGRQHLPLSGRRARRMDRGERANQRRAVKSELRPSGPSDRRHRGARGGPRYDLLGPSAVDAPNHASSRGREAGSPVARCGRALGPANAAHREDRRRPGQTLAATSSTSAIGGHAASTRPPPTTPTRGAPPSGASDAWASAVAMITAGLVDRAIDEWEISTAARRSRTRWPRSCWCSTRQSETGWSRETPLGPSPT